MGNWIAKRTQAEISIYLRIFGGTMGAVDSKPICLTCGLCCDGSLFADVKLTSEDASRLGSSLPASAARGNSRQLRLLQPCFAFCGGKCSVYESRPMHCRKFDCDLLSKVEQGRVSAADAGLRIQECRRKVDEVKRLLRLLGNSDERASISARFKQASRLAMQAKGDRKQALLFGDLTIAVQELHCLLSEHIYPV